MLFSKYDAWLIFYSDNAATVFEASCHAFHNEKLLIKIYFQWKRTHVTSRDAEESLNLLKFVIT